MIEKTKITLSNKELELVRNTDWIFTKQKIIDTIYHLFGNIVNDMQELINGEQENFPEMIHNSEPKISKGENYLGLPYVMLDYPRCFEKEGIQAIRTFFWWGNFFSVTLQLSGKYKLNLLPALLRCYESLATKDYCICINEDQWQHHFKEDNYLPVKSFTEIEFAAILNREAFIKISKNISLNEWNSVPVFIGNVFAELTDLLKKGYAPNR
jgi:hypothetical protein